MTEWLDDIPGWVQLLYFIVSLIVMVLAGYFYLWGGRSHGTVRDKTLLDHVRTERDEFERLHKKEAEEARKYKSLYEQEVQSHKETFVEADRLIEKYRGMAEAGVGFAQQIQEGLTTIQKRRASAQDSSPPALVFEPCFEPDEINLGEHARCVFRFFNNTDQAIPIVAYQFEGHRKQFEKQGTKGWPPAVQPNYRRAHNWGKVDPLKKYCNHLGSGLDQDIVWFLQRPR